MRRSVCTKWIEKYLGEAVKDGGKQKHLNPGALFCQYAKKGVFHKISDDGYHELLAETEELAELWEKDYSKSSGELFVKFLSRLKMSREEIHLIAELLTDYYAAAHGEFTEENRVPGKDDDGNRLPDMYGLCKKTQRYERYMKKGNSEEEETFDPHFAESPRAIKEYLSSKIYGQEEAVKAASILLYNHIRKRKRNILFIGPTGCGKTEIWRVMKKIYPNIRIVDSSAITMQGWSGGFKIQDIFRGMKTEEIEKSIIVFDEFDKFCEPVYSGSGANYSAAGQNELLKMIEGSRISFGSDNGREAVDFDSSGMSFVFCGSFEQLVGKKTASEQKESIGFGRDGEKKDAGAQYLNKITAQDLIEYAGVRQEIAGRIQQIVQLHPLTEKDFRCILKDKKISPVRKLEKMYGVTIHLEERTERKLAGEAAKNGFGVRYLRNRLQEYLDEQMYNEGEKKEYWIGNPVHVPFAGEM